MPGFDQKGPMGKGPMTGRRMGRCTNFGANLDKQSPSDSTDEITANPQEEFRTNNMEYGMGRGRFGRGQGRGMRNRFRGGN